MEEAVSNQASDIHFQPEREGMMIRERVHGNLIPRSTVPALYSAQLINQLKMMCGMTIESRLPQDKRLNLQMQIGSVSQLVRLRVSSLPSHHGDSVVMRLLPDVDTLPTLDGTGFSPQPRAGPTGHRGCQRHDPGHRPYRQRQDHPDAHHPARTQ
ncbi:ATPase, T2SS/T4P/T4SS family [Deinococcus sp. KNUC1210]|uniref:ATPase, T2SS/T4P/T4SS family n=1 Tax=Deinococcus sp. KNUC1210 TaxID=2917691 RepID=UPI00351D05D0